MTAFITPSLLEYGLQTNVNAIFLAQDSRIGQRAALNVDILALGWGLFFFEILNHNALELIREGVIDVLTATENLLDPSIGLGPQMRAAVGDANAHLESFLLNTLVPVLTRAGSELDAPVLQIRDALVSNIPAWLETIRNTGNEQIGATFAASQEQQDATVIEGERIALAVGGGLAALLEAMKDQGGQPLAEWLASVTPHSDPAPTNRVTTTESISPFLQLPAETLLFLVRRFGDVLSLALKGIFAGAEGLAPAFTPLIDETLNSIQNRVEDLGQVSPGEAFAVAREFLQVAMTNGLKARLTSSFMEVAGAFPKNFGFSQIAGLMGELGGFQQLADAVWGNALKSGIGRPAEYQVNALTLSKIPSEGQLIEAAIERKVSVDALRELLKFHGYADRFVDMFINTMWTDPRLREIILLASDVSVSQDDVSHWLAEAGYDDTDIKRMTPVVMQQSIKAQSQAFISEVMANLREGYLDDEEGEAQLGRLNMNAQGVRLLLDAGRMGFRRDMINESLRTFEQAFTNDQMSEEEFTLALEGIGINKSKVSVIVGRNVSKRLGRVAQQEEAQSSKQIREFQTASLATLKAQFQERLITAEGFLANLVALGFLPSVAREIVTLEQLRLLSKIEGTQAAEAEKLEDDIRRARIAAFAELFQDGFINDEELLRALVQLGLEFDLAQAIAFREKAKKAALPKPTTTTTTQ